MFNFQRNRDGAPDGGGRSVWTMLVFAAFTAWGLVMASAVVVPYEPEQSVESPRHPTDAQCLVAVSPLASDIGVAYFDDPLRLVGACQ